jgi:hypothetical protein
VIGSAGRSARKAGAQPAGGDRKKTGALVESATGVSPP